jgi:hypothetical protein
VKRWTLVLLLTAACYPTTTRPALTPVPEALIAEWELFVPQAMRTLALALDADSIPVSRTEPEDGWLETPWFDARSYQPVTRRPLGEETVRIRAWADPARPNHSAITLEIVYRPVADPSREGRTLERQVNAAHPVAQKVAAMMERLRKEHGG